MLNERHIGGAFQRSFQLTEGRFERWLEMIVVSVLLVLGVALADARSCAVPIQGIAALDAGSSC